MYDTKFSQESYIRSPIHRFMNCLITFSINHKRHGEKIPSQNLFYLWSIITPRVVCNTLYMLAKIFGGKA